MLQHQTFVLLDEWFSGSRPFEWYVKRTFEVQSLAGTAGWARVVASFPALSAGLTSGSCSRGPQSNPFHVSVRVEVK
jgi:hypothetical protein